ncbi:10488_t:CDS:2 [Funneliformis geosporum]|nr:10488_t:CDS:2 [Funneliformis geosporum]
MLSTHDSRPYSQISNDFTPSNQVGPLIIEGKYPFDYIPSNETRPISRANSPFGYVPSTELYLQD